MTVAIGRTRVVRGIRRSRTALAGLIVGLCAFALPTSAAQAQEPVPWTCDAFGYLFQSEAPSPVGQVHQIDLVTGATTLLGQTVPNDNVNAVGYNTLDDLFYGWDQSGVNAGSVVQIDSNRELTPVDTPMTFPGAAIGDFDDQGQYWTLTDVGGTNAEYFQIDYAPGSASFGQLIENDVTDNPSNLGSGQDWAFIDEHAGQSLRNFYRIAIGADGAHLVSFDPENPEAQEDVGLIPGITNPSNFGATYADAAGFLWGARNADGRIFRVDPSTLDSIELEAIGPRTTTNDGARCANAVIPTVAVTKTAARVDPRDQFTVTLEDETGDELDSATTSGTDTTASTVDFPVSQLRTFTITDAMAPGSASTLAAYEQSIACTDAAGNPAATGGTAPEWTLTVAAATAYRCNVTNAGPPIRCFGERITIVVSEPGMKTVGTDGDDVILGTRGRDNIKGGKGRDRICGQGGRDRIKGQGGRDRLHGQGGRDRVNGQGGNDRVLGGKKKDKLVGKAGKDTLLGKTGRDKLKGGKGKDRLNGARGKDRLNGGKGNDKLKAKNGHDRLNGGPGRDKFKGGKGNDKINAADGVAEKVNGGPGKKDRVVADRVDKVSKVEKVKLKG